MAKSSGPSKAALTAALDAATEAGQLAADKAGKAAARARETAMSAAEVWPELLGAAGAGFVDGAGYSMPYTVQGVTVPTVPLIAGGVAMFAKKPMDPIHKAGRGMVIYAAGLVAAQLAQRIRV